MFILPYYQRNDSVGVCVAGLHLRLISILIVSRFASAVSKTVDLLYSSDTGQLAIQTQKTKYCSENVNCLQKSNLFSI